MHRTLRGTSVTLNVSVIVDETTTDPTPDTATVTVTRADGTPVVTDATAINGANGGFSYTLVPAQTALLDTLTATWTFSLNGQPQSLETQTEVVGGYHFSLAQFRQLEPMGDSAKYPTSKLFEARTYAETVIEDACGLAFVPRYWFGTITGWPPPVAEITGIRSATAYNGVVLSESELLDSLNGSFWPWRRCYGRWTVGVEHGLSACPADVARASMLLARSYLVGSGSGGTFDERATSISYADAGLTYSLITAGARGAPTSLGEVNAVIDRYRVPVA